MAETATEPLLALLQKHWLGGCTVSMPSLDCRWQGAGILFAARYFVVVARVYNYVALFDICRQRQTVTSTFSIVPQSSTHIRVIYRSCYCLDLQCRHGHFVSVRDGAYSTFETNKVVECLNPIPNLQVCFLGNA